MLFTGRAVCIFQQTSSQAKKYRSQPNDYSNGRKSKWASLSSNETNRTRSMRYFSGDPYRRLINSAAEFLLDSGDSASWTPLSSGLFNRLLKRDFSLSELLIRKSALIKAYREVQELMLLIFPDNHHFFGPSFMHTKIALELPADSSGWLTSVD